jgi:hypothetical protein
MRQIVGNSQNHQQEKEPGHRNLLHLSPPLTPGARILWDFTAAGRVGIPGRNTGISGIAQTEPILISLLIGEKWILFGIIPAFLGFCP